ncbi:polysaccharide deacetylase family protein [Asticcacaulis sp. BYS171W]|uniref:Chitooligosaccharide deacetylase n=1 Tax=Asticcacaulis aquaticus TaxID=2984212 RepID=A0ABT5HZD2_9CAUL|nr:polysaccharide deacetylase family protein [Asticcacaulis aquaticus]MDC7685282.1 polysaccharide deacetylase family protein [Asticcacaulis aquaticus]
MYRYLLCFAFLSSLLTPAVAKDRFDVVVTVDDLPLQGQLTPGETRLGITQSYLKTLKAHKVPQAYGFINAGKLDNAPDGAAVYDLWQANGYPLGNHGYTHMNLGRAESLEAWIADMEQNEPELKRRVKDDSWRVIRMPNLAGGGKGARHDGAVAWMKSHRYIVAEVTMYFSDASYSAPYNRCLAKGDMAGIAALDGYYLAQVDAGIARAKRQSEKIYGRQIPQIWLTHLSAYSARMLPQVMDRLDAAGARYIPLAQALKDDAYSVPDSEIGNGLMMERVAKRLGVDIKEPPSGVPKLDLATLCL